MECNVCDGTFISWDNRMLQQLTVDVRSRFPAVLTRKYGCDISVVGLLRARTLGNSPTALCHNLHEVHSEEWMRKQLSYLGDCRVPQVCNIHILHVPIYISYSIILLRDVTYLVLLLLPSMKKRSLPTILWTKVVFGCIHMGCVVTPS